MKNLTLDHQKKEFEQAMKNKGASKLKNVSLERFFFQNGKMNDILLTTAEDKTMTAYAVYYQRKIKTERMICLDLSENPTANRITKVTILD